MVEKGGLWALCNRSGLTQKHMLFLLARAKPNTYQGCRNLALDFTNLLFIYFFQGNDEILRLQ